MAGNGHDDFQEQEGTLTQASYVPTGYADMSWEVVGEIRDNQEFTPMSIEVVSDETAGMVDPMFADYGGITPGAQKRRWHLPKEIAGAFAAPDSDDAPADGGPAEDTIALSASEIEALKEDAFKAGLEQGAAEKAAEQEAELAQVAARLEGLIADLSNQVKEELFRVERDAVSLSLSIAEKMVGYAVEINPEYILRIVHDALSLAGGANIRKVRVSPEDMEFIEVLGVAKQIKGYDGTWEFAADETIRSGCVVETSSGEVDYRLDLAWERVKENVLKAIK